MFLTGSQSINNKRSKGPVNVNYGHGKMTSYITGPQGPYWRERVTIIILQDIFFSIY